MLNYSEWKTFLDALLPGHTYELSYVDNALRLKTDKAQGLLIKKRLDEMLKTSVSFRRFAPYVMQSAVDRSSKDELYDRPVQPLVNSVEHGKQRLLNLFGEELADGTGIGVHQLFGNGAYFENGLLFSKEAAKIEIMNFWREALKETVKRLHKVSLSTVRKAWNGEGSLPLNNSELNELQDATLADGTILPCLRQQNMRICVDLKRLYQLIAPPEIKLVNDPMNESCFVEVDANHMFDYVRQCSKTKGGFLLRVYKDTAEANHAKGQLIVLDRASAVPKPNIYTFVLDRSGSMTNDFEDLKDRFIEFLEKLKELDPKAKIRIVFFHTERDEPLEYDLSKTSIDEIKQQITPILAEGATRLNLTMQDELNYAKTNPDRETHNQVIVLFTDGKDERAETVSINELTENINQFDRACVPTIITLGFGTGYEAQSLGDLASATGSMFYHLDEVEDINQLLKPSFTQSSRKLRDVLVRIIENSEYTITHQGKINQKETLAPQIPDIVIPFKPNATTSLSLDGNEILITVPDFSKIAVVNGTDKLREFAIAARKIMADSNLSVPELTKKLHLIQNDVNEVPCSPDGNIQKQALLTEIDGYQSLLKKTEAHVGYKVSASVMARSSSGFFAATPKSYAPASHSVPSSHAPAAAGAPSGDIPEEAISPSNS